MDKAQFIRDIAATGGDSRAAEMVWDALLAGGLEAGFTPYPDDSLARIYGIAEEELEVDLVARIFKEIGLPLPDSAAAKTFGTVDSPRRLVQFVSRCRSG